MTQENIAWVVTPESVILERFSYNSATNVLTIEYKEQERVYDFYDVPEWMAFNLKQADNYGLFINQHIIPTYRRARR